MRKFLQYFTFYDENEIEKIIQKSLKNQQDLYAHEKLADSLTLLIHGGKVIIKFVNNLIQNLIE